MTPEKCAAAIFRGVERDRAVILPGPARIAWFLHQHFPVLTNLMARKLAAAVWGPAPGPSLPAPAVAAALPQATGWTPPSA